MNEKRDSFICDICGQIINSRPNLNRHKAAKHSSTESHPIPRAIVSLDPSHAVGDAPVLDVSAWTPSMTCFLDHLLNLASNPCVCLDCSLRSLVGFILPSLLNAQFGGSFDFVSAGFPIRRRKSGNATCIDFLLFQTEPSREWWMVEMAFHEKEIRLKRLERYRKACLEGMPARVADLRKLQEDSRGNQRRTFRTLIRTIKSYDIDAPIHFIAIMPHPIKLKELSGIDVLTWHELWTLCPDGLSSIWGKLTDLILTQIPTPVRGGIRDVFNPIDPNNLNPESNR